MNKTATACKPTKRPPARIPRKRRADPSPARPDYQVGRSVRAWLEKYAGELSIALGWVFAFAVVFMPKEPATFATVLECTIAGAGLLGFGAGWHVRDDRGKR